MSAARQRAPRRGIRFVVGDAQALDFSDATFDRAVSLLALNFVPDPAQALAEQIRVTRPGGLIAAAVWDYGDGMQMLRAFWDEAVAADPAAASRATSATCRSAGTASSPRCGCRRACSRWASGR